ncbi:MAG: hypothetical protein ACRDH8_13485 [Actinomycetota bacterium]
MPMRCETAELELSARLDGERDPQLDDSLADHVATCARCRAFEARAGRLRKLVRLEPAPPVPDLVPRIMDGVQQNRVPGTVRRLRPGRPVPAWGRYAAAFAAGALVAALVVGGLPGLRPGPSPALATEIPEGIAEASSEVTAYRATFEITERNYHPRVPRRTFTAEVAFAAPERFRSLVTDTTSYPSTMWPRNDLRLEVDGARWLFEGPRMCPREALPACAPAPSKSGDLPPPGGPNAAAPGVTGREPFDGDALMPTDIVLPVRTLAGTDRVRVVGEDRTLGRETVVVELAYRDATPLFAYLQAGGSWRPFFPVDRVLVSLDAETWFPLAYEVRAASSPERDAWAVRNGLPAERSGSLLFEAEARSLSTEAVHVPPPPALDAPRDEGFRDASREQLPELAGYEPAAPGELLGLRPYRSGTFETTGRPADEVLLSFSRGLSWLKIRQTRTWAQPALFGDVGPLAEPVTLGPGVGYYEPATASLGRRVSIHAAGLDLYVESNLPRDELLRVAASIPIRGLEAPAGWLERITLAEARRKAPFLLLPTSLPAGYRLAAVQPSDGGATVTFRRPDTELDGVGIRLHQSPGDALSPPLEPGVLAVVVRGQTGRYSPERGELEWVEDGIYRSLSGTALDLGGLVAVAESLEPPR